MSREGTLSENKLKSQSGAPVYDSSVGEFITPFSLWFMILISLGLDGVIH